MDGENEKGKENCASGCLERKTSAPSQIAIAKVSLAGPHNQSSVIKSRDETKTEEESDGLASFKKKDVEAFTTLKVDSLPRFNMRYETCSKVDSSILREANNNYNNTKFRAHDINSITNSNNSKDNHVSYTRDKIKSNSKKSVEFEDVNASIRSSNGKDIYPRMYDSSKLKEKTKNNQVADIVSLEDGGVETNKEDHGLVCDTDSKEREEDERKMTEFQMSGPGKEYEADNFKKKYGITNPSPRKRKIAVGNKCLLELLSALIHEIKFEAGKVLDGAPITAMDMAAAIEKGKRMKLLKYDLKPEKALYRYMKNMNKIENWYRGDSKTGYEMIKDGRKIHSCHGIYCPFGHCYFGKTKKEEQFRTSTSSPREPNPYQHAVDSSNDAEFNGKSKKELEKYIKTLEDKLKSREDLLKAEEQKLVTPSLNDQTQNSPWLCNICNRRFRRASHLKRHFLKLHPRVEFSIDSKKVPCPLCSRKVSPQNLVRHQRSANCFKFIKKNKHIVPHHPSDNSMSKKMSPSKVDPKLQVPRSSSQTQKPDKDLGCDFYHHCQTSLRPNSQECLMNPQLSSHNETNQIHKKTKSNLKGSITETLDHLHGDLPRESSVAALKIPPKHEISEENCEDLCRNIIDRSKFDEHIEEISTNSPANASSKGNSVMPCLNNPDVIKSQMKSETDTLDTLETVECLKNRPDYALSNNNVYGGFGEEFDAVVASAAEYYKLDNQEKGNLQGLLHDLTCLDYTFKDELEKFKQSRAHYAYVKDCLYSHYLYKQGKEQRPTPDILPGFLQDLWLKLVAFGLPFLERKYKDFTSEWLFDTDRRFFKGGVSGDPFDIFVLSEKDIKECVNSSYLHLSNPSLSQETLVKGFRYLLDAQKRFIDDNEDNFKKYGPEVVNAAQRNIDEAVEKKRKICLTIEHIQPLRKNLRRTYRKDKRDKQQLKNEKNPNLEDQVKASLAKYHQSQERSSWFAELKAMYRRMKESRSFCPPEDFYSLSVEFIFTELLTSTPLRPKGWLTYCLSFS